MNNFLGFVNGISLANLQKDAARQRLFGDHSQFAEILRAAAASVDPNVLVEGIAALDGLIAKQAMIAGHSDILPEYLEQTLLGLKYLLNVNQAIVAKQDATAAFNGAVAAFDKAWGVNSLSNSDESFDQKGFFAAIGEQDRFRQLVEIGRPSGKPSPGYWFVFDTLVRNWANWFPAGTLPENLQSICDRKKVAVAPILLVSRSQKSGGMESVTGLFKWLEVEIFQGCGSGFDPDPLTLGLTGLRRDGAAPGTDFISIMRGVWKKSGLDASYRGRWRILHRYPADLMENNKLIPSNDFHIPLLEGPSGEAAALAAIWAAASEVPYETPFSLPQPLRLVPYTGVSAKLGEVPAEGPLTDIPLLAVQGVPQKLSAAQEAKLLTVIFAGDDYKDQKVQDLIAANKAKRQKPGPHDIMEPLELKTIGSVLDQMLVVNRWLDIWQKKSAANWLGDWRDTAGPDGQQVNTGSLEWMLAAVSADEKEDSDVGQDE